MGNWFDEIEIWAFAGKMGCGKNYLAEKVFLDLLAERDVLFSDSVVIHAPLVVAFADHLKIHCLGLCAGVTYESVFGQKTLESRQILQSVGSEMRQTVGVDVWVRILENWIRMHASRGVKRFLLTDLRHQNELAWAKSVGAKTIYIKAEARNLDRLEHDANRDQLMMARLSSHESETSLDGLEREFTLVVDNDYGDEEKAVLQLKSILLPRR